MRAVDLRESVLGHPHHLVAPIDLSLRGCVLFGECVGSHRRHHHVVAYSSDLSDAQWNLLEPLLVTSSKRGPKHGDDLRHVVDAMLYISHTGCQWRFLPDQFGPWTRVWSQFRRWSRTGTWARVLGPARVVTLSSWSTRRAALDGGHRHPSRTRSIERRGHLPQPGWSLLSNQRGQANRSRGRHRSATLRESCPRLDVRSTGRRTHSRTSRESVLTNASNSCSWTAGPRSQPVSKPR